jgi:2-keto-4-pentenoate hydratase/2-oxohepta-3-ene-1,7-dioic acid hydratase in catechol pathway
MRLASIHTDHGPTVVAVVADEVVLLDGIPADIPGVLASSSVAFERIHAAIDSGKRRVALADVRLAAPIARPGKFLAVGLNYADHVAESGVETPEFPTFFAKMPSCVAGPYDDVQRPLVSEAVDYEGELGLVIGRRCRHVSADRAHEVIGGYLVVNDLSVRDYQFRTSQWILGKSFDTHGVLGPWIVTADEVRDPHALGIRTTVNGETRQHSNTSNLIHNCFALVEALSSVCTLEPGDIVATGTPGGVGMAADPPRWLRPGDIVEVEIEHLGATRNTIVLEPSAL